MIATCTKVIQTERLLGRLTHPETPLFMARPVPTNLPLFDSYA